ncbi:MAG: MFS transporter [Candidatus Rokubacteria bacterium]|nr:MFS transporter [Candidatus Rokubacteria bacterium]
MTADPSPERWQRNVWALALCVFIAFVGFQFFSPFLPLYVRELGVIDPARIALWSGALTAVTPTVSGLMSPLFGRLADRFGWKIMLIRSLAGFTVIIAAMGLVRSVEQLFVARFLQGLVAGFTPMAMAAASVAAPREKVSVAIARVQSAQLLSVAVGPLAGGIVASRVGIRPAFFITAGLCAIALVALIVLFREVQAPAAGVSRRGGPRTPLRVFLGYPHFLVAMGLLLIAQFVDRALSLLIPLQVAHMPGIEPAATSGVIISVAAIGAAGSASLAARVAQAIPAGRLLVAQLVAGGLFCGAMAFADHWVPLLVLRTLAALCLGGALTLAYSLGGMLVPGETRGAAFGWLALGVQVGTAASPLVTGAIGARSLGAAVGAGLLAFGARGLLHRRGEMSDG